MRKAAILGAFIGGTWMALLLSVRVSPLIYNLVYFTDFIGMKTYDYLPHGKGIAPAIDIWIFNGWMIFTTAVEWSLIFAALWRLSHRTK